MDKSINLEQSLVLHSNLLENHSKIPRKHESIL